MAGTTRIAVLRFPGVNCEEETRRAVLAAGASCDIFRWNGAPADLREYDGYVLPGGFSYQDRVRAGAIAAKDHVMKCICEEAESGKAVIGICNGAQVLLESGLVPGCETGRVEMGLATNVMPGRDGYHTNWTHLRVETSGTSATSALSAGDVVPIPVAHAEGRFVTADDALVDRLFEAGQVVMSYTGPGGEDARGFPRNPNGSTRDIAAVANPRGNVVAMMPHPERAAWLFQVPANLEGAWGERRRSARKSDAMRAPGPGAAILTSLVRHCIERPS
jgi:phosphoribosylformylglycinamidine synthase